MIPRSGLQVKTYCKLVSFFVFMGSSSYWERLFNKKVAQGEARCNGFNADQANWKNYFQTLDVVIVKIV